MVKLARTRRLELYLFDAWHRQHVDDAGRAADQLLVLLDGQQHMRRPAAIRDEHRAIPGRFLGTAGILIELAAG